MRRRLFDNLREHDVFTFAFAIAFQAFVALVALVLLALAVLGEIGRQDAWTRDVGPHLEKKVLPNVYAGMNQVVHKIFTTSSVGLIALATAISVLQLAGVVRTCTRAIARIYGQREDRPAWRRYSISLGIAIVLTGAVLGAMLLGTAARTAVHGGWSVPFTIARWLVAALLIAVAFALLVRFGPPRPRATRWVSAGSGLVAIGWIVQTLIYAEYLSLTNYRSAALSLLGAYFLTSYLLVGAVILLVGIEIDELLRKERAS